MSESMLEWQIKFHQKDKPNSMIQRQTVSVGLGLKQKEPILRERKQRVIKTAVPKGGKGTKPVCPLTNECQGAGGETKVEKKGGGPFKDLTGKTKKPIRT